MVVVWVFAAIVLFLLGWIGMKLVIIIERQNTSKENIISIQQQLEQQLQIITEKISGTNSSNIDLFQKFSEKLHKIDAAQNNIKELANYVVDLKELFTDKRSRGAFGEAQLTSLINNLIPSKFTKFQHSLSNGKRADCLVILPPPTNPIVIDAKFPLENFKQMLNFKAAEPQHLEFKRLFKTDIKTHIDAISSKYIIPPETADSAIMFIPAEAIFAEIHAFHPDLVEYAHKKRVWLTSPSTVMAILTTAASVIKDDITQKNLDEIRGQLQKLELEFTRFDDRLQNLFKHINMCSDDASKVQVSAQKIIQKFNKITELETNT